MRTLLTWLLLATTAHGNVPPDPTVVIEGKEVFYFLGCNDEDAFEEVQKDIDGGNHQSAKKLLNDYIEGEVCGVFLYIASSSEKLVFLLHTFMQQDRCVVRLQTGGKAYIFWPIISPEWIE